ncbi:hypothetical protein MMC15_004062 [Xylographa vitiligo]|nr:hypothetical protein [Xylographa vitiligo]
MGRPRKRRAISPAVSLPSQLVPATIAPSAAFDFSDLAFDASPPSMEWGALAQLEFPPLGLGSEWGALSDEFAAPAWDPHLMPASPTSPKSHPALPAPAPSPLPASSPLPTIPPPPCACLPTMYLTLSALQTLPPTFPLALPPLRAATDAVRRMLACPTCAPPSLPPGPPPTTTITAPFPLPTSLPNTMLLATLIPHIAHRYAQLLAAIDRDAASGARKTFRVGETANPLLEALHTGREACPVAVEVEVEMEAREWRGMMRGVVRRDLLGEGGLGGLVERMGERQRGWHEVGRRWGWKKGGGEGEGEPMCLRVVEAARCAVEMVDVS